MRLEALFKSIFACFSLLLSLKEVDICYVQNDQNKKETHHHIHNFHERAVITVVSALTNNRRPEETVHTGTANTTIGR